MTFPYRKTVERLREQYPAGSLVVLDEMDDIQAREPGTFGTVKYVDDAGNIGVAWHGGGSLSVAYGADRCHLADPEEKAKYRLLLVGGEQERGTAPEGKKAFYGIPRCPRCGGVPERKKLYAMSRRADIRICENCGTLEALEDAGMADKIPLTAWAAVKEEW